MFTLSISELPIRPFWNAGPTWPNAIAPSISAVLLPTAPLMTLSSSENPFTEKPRIALFWKSLSCMPARRTSGVLLR